MPENLLIAAALLFGVNLLAGAPLLLGNWSDRVLHRFVGLSAGIFLGTVFLHLVPELADVAVENADAPGMAGGRSPWIAMLAGFLTLFFVERVWLAEKVEDDGSHDSRHKVLWYAALAGLALHAAVAGVGLAAVAVVSEAKAGLGLSVLFLAILMHKASESLSLATVMRLAGLSKTRSTAYLAAFSLITPVFLFLGTSIFDPGSATAGIFMGLAAGTFLYVAVCDLLPEVFHGERRLPEAAALVLGVILAGAGENDTFLVDAGVALVDVFLEMSAWLLLGFAIAGIISQWLNPERLKPWLAERSVKSVVIASLVGAPLPLCSCSVLPVAISLRRAGASRGATSSFLISTPETGVDSVALSYGLLDPFLTIARPIGAIFSAIFTGLLVNATEGPDEAVPDPKDEPADRGGSTKTPAEGGHDHSHVASDPGKPSLRGAMHFAFVEMMDDLAAAILFGLAISAGIYALLPPEIFEQPIFEGVWGYIVMLLIGIPIYVCASASTPIAAAMILKGLSPGAAVVFLLASPATNTSALFVILKELGRRTLIAYLVGLAICTLIVGWAVDAGYRILEITPSVRVGAEGHEHVGVLSIVAAVVLAVLLAVSLWRTSRPDPADSCCD
jgi:hypothetical protein